MSPEDVAKAANRMIAEIKKVPAPGYSNYKAVIAEYQRLLNDTLVLIRELAEAEATRGIVVTVKDETKE